MAVPPADVETHDPAAPKACADCGLLLTTIWRRSAYFHRPLCESCYDDETQRSSAEGEVFVLERMVNGFLPDVELQ